jgi:hypothetical protein
MNDKINNSVQSLSNQNKQDKEIVSGELTETEKKLKQLIEKYKSTPGKLPGNRCVFGKHNSDFNKKCL